ncbi:mitochondrial processing protease 53 kDa subunit [Nadsonia fulvescens var. elongata DSM 6958]|uniref:Alpha-MPP n=1 Tax=Nadsonia fulvescens var. elongata DSM 6958 TaxID=857566 RepID=A0A1E3PCS0_9ASCO|nr:mitochondrial processing protease 53 kDa subunit [Nadsonia fulvescens var. elongata DSM 6958]
MLMLQKPGVNLIKIPHSLRGLSRRLVTKGLARRSLATTPAATVSQGEGFRLTTLPNGLRVATEYVPSHFSSMGIYVDVGSRYEGERYSGLGHLVDRLAFKSTANRSAVEMIEGLESLGGNNLCASSRETMIYQAAVFNKDVEQMFALLSETVVCPQITEDEVADQRDTAAYEISEIWQKPELILPEVTHMVAYEGTLGNPLLCPEERLPMIDASLVREYRAQFYRPEKMVAVFTGVEHSRAVSLAERYLTDSFESPGALASIATSATINTSDSDRSKEIALYKGGETCLDPPPPNGQPEFSHMHIAFEALSINDPDIYAVAALQTLLGGGGSFSAGGPGKGMYSRLYTNVLNQYGFVESCVSYNHSYRDSGLFGISATCIPQAAPYMADVICRQLALTFSNGTGSLTETEVARAKNQLRSSLLMNLESKMVELEDIGRQVQLQGTRIPVNEMCDNIAALSVRDIKRVAERVLTGNVYNNGHSGGKATIVMQGNRESFGDVEAVIKRYGLGNYNREAILPKVEKKWFW